MVTCFMSMVVFSLTSASNLDNHLYASISGTDISVGSAFFIARRMEKLVFYSLFQLLIPSRALGVEKSCTTFD